MAAIKQPGAVASATTNRANNSGPPITTKSQASASAERQGGPEATVTGAPSRGGHSDLKAGSVAEAAAATTASSTTMSAVRAEQASNSQVSGTASQASNSGLSRQHEMQLAGQDSGPRHQSVDPGRGSGKRNEAHGNDGTVPNRPGQSQVNTSQNSAGGGLTTRNGSRALSSRAHRSTPPSSGRAAARALMAGTDTGATMTRPGRFAAQCA